LWPPLCWAVLAFVAYAFWRYRNSDIEYVARLELIRVLVYAVFFFATLNNLNRQEAGQSVVSVLVFIGLALSVYAVFQFITHTEMVWKYLRPASYGNRGSGTYVCPNHLAGFLEMVLPLALAHTLSGRLPHAVKIVFGYAALVMLAGIGVTLSRGGWIATIAGLLLFIFLYAQRRNVRVPAIVFLGLLILGSVWFISTAQYSKERFKVLYQTGKFDETRFHLWKPAVEMWKDNPWIGVGPGHFDARFRQYRPELIQRRPDRVHNDYLNTLADWGIIGAALVATAWALLFLGAWQTWKYVARAQNDLGGSHGNREAFLLGAVVGLASLLVHSVTDFNFHIPANALVAVTIMALIAGHWRYASDRFWISFNQLGRVAFSVIAMACMFYLGQEAMRRLQEDSLLRHAAKTPENSREYIGLLVQANQAEPMNPDTPYRIGEAWRAWSWQGGEDHEKQAGEAMQWFEKAMALNRWNPDPPMRYGMCLDWLGRNDEADKWFDRAAQLDPNSYYLVAHLGWHAVQRGDWAKAKEFFERSIKLEWNDNPIARSYLDIVNQRLKENTPK
ncbi:MAG: O-antigen ligase family protein, partial [Verrucomicrobia bacterium]|nr:O-antigen ligase family protein [Verrucomicrobiota bacterium]